MGLEFWSMRISLAAVASLVLSLPLLFDLTGIRFLLFRFSAALRMLSPSSR